jgi:hypothetical protein
MTTTTVKQAREAVEAAQFAYLAADINHPTQIITTKEALTHARHEYWNACANFCTKLEFSVDLAEVHENLVIQGLWV